MRQVQNNPCSLWIFQSGNHRANKWIPPNLSLPTKHNRSVLLKWTCNVWPNYKKRQKITNSSATGESGDRKALHFLHLWYSSPCDNGTQVRRERCNFLQRQSIQFSISGEESGVIWLMSESSAVLRLSWPVKSLDPTLTITTYLPTTSWVPSILLTPLKGRTSFTPRINQSTRNLHRAAALVNLFYVFSFLSFLRALSADFQA